jgi:putative ATP-dependent endonuclease of the OLD family
MHEQFWNVSLILKNSNSEDYQIREALPFIEARLTLEYSDESESFGPLSDFIIDLDPDCNEALIVIRYELEDGKINALLGDIQLEENKSHEQHRTTFFKAIKERVPKFFKATVQAVDPNDFANQKSLEISRLHALLQSGFILSGAENFSESQVENRVTRENSIRVSNCCRFLIEAEAGGGFRRGKGAKLGSGSL